MPDAPWTTGRGNCRLKPWRSPARRRRGNVARATRDRAAVNGRAEILLDSGIRRGSDVVKALCLGARAVLCGRAYAYGLAAGAGLE